MHPGVSGSKDQARRDWSPRGGATGVDCGKERKGVGRGALQMGDSGGLVDFLGVVGRLKRLPRTGWVRHGVRDVESVAAHMYRMAVLAYVAAHVHNARGGSTRVEPEHCVAVAIAHDLAEAVAGDITPFDGVSKEEKHRKEKEGLDYILGLLQQQDQQQQTGMVLGMDGAAKGLRALWEEYEGGVGDTAVLLKDMDKLEMIVQAAEYAEEQPQLDLRQFFETTRGRFGSEVGSAWAAEVAGRHDAHVEKAAKRREKGGKETEQHQSLGKNKRPGAGRDGDGKGGGAEGTEAEQVQKRHKKTALEIPRVGVACLLVGGGPLSSQQDAKKILVGKRRGSHGSGTWQLPGGHLDHGEEWANCAARECLEETGLRVDPGTGRHVATANNVIEGRHYVTLFVRFDVDMVDVGKPRVEEPDKCECWEWVAYSHEQVPRPRLPPLQDLLDSYVL